MDNFINYNKTYCNVRSCSSCNDSFIKTSPEERRKKKEERIMEGKIDVRREKRCNYDCKYCRDLINRTSEEDRYGIKHKH